MIIKDGNDVLAFCDAQNKHISEIASMWEHKNTGVSEENIRINMEKAYNQMKKSVENGLSEKNNTPRETKAKMLKDDAKKIKKYSEQVDTITGDTVTKAMSYALSVMEVNCSMGRVVASPTAGSCGVLPAAIITLQEKRQLEDTEALKGLMNAGIIGAIIGKNASLAGAEGGCQAEIGAASAMAASALVEMSGGTPNMCFNAAAIALKNILGLVCDPVAGLVEVPCAKRNAMGVSNAMICADMALAGVESVIPFDEVVWAMGQIGKTMPATLKETSEGGLAVTPTGKKLRKQIYK